ncbi:MAG: GH3 auxin-responsive promoter family protein [Elainellaceae cyanobacterium]
MQDLAFSALSAVALRARSKLVAQTAQLEATQAAFLRSLLEAHKDTAFGRKHGLADISTVEQFRERIPVRPYSAFEPYVQRMAHGEANVLVPDPLIYFNISSGSTGKKKLIPVTKRSRRFLSRSSRAAVGFVFGAAVREKRPPGKMLFPISSNSMGQTPSGIAFAPVSTSDMRLMDVLSRQIFAYPFEAFQISDTTARYYVCLLFALRNQHLRTIGATFPVLALQLCTFLERHAESLVQDIKTGQIADWLTLEPALRRILERKWSAAPQRALALQRTLSTQGRLTPKAAWPNLSFMVTARGGTSDFYFERFPEYFGDLPVFGGTYSCAEGVLGISHDFNTDSVIPAIASAFIEFIPEDQWNEQHPKTVLPQEVLLGQRYRIVFTNYSGFYRYDLGDVVEISGFFEQAPLMTFKHRRGRVISASTEKTTEAHVIDAMQKLQQQFDVVLENFCVTLSKDVIPAHYLVNIEVAAGSQLGNPQQFLQQFDETMKARQKFYGIKRRDQIPPPRLRILAPGSFEKLRLRMIQNGVTEAQLKFPHVSEDRDWLSCLAVVHEERLTGDGS